MVCLLAPRLRSEKVGLSGTKSQVLSVNEVLGVRLSDNKKVSHRDNIATQNKLVSNPSTKIAIKT